MTEYACFECGSEEDIHHHHVVPKSLGGTKTIPLCSRCHSLVHGTDLTSTSILTKKALNKRIMEGKAVSSAPFGLKISGDKDLVVNPDEASTIKLIQELRSAPYGKAKNRKTPWRVVADQLNKMGITNRAGHPWKEENLYAVMRHHKRYAHLFKKPF